MAMPGQRRRAGPCHQHPANACTSGSSCPPSLPPADELAALRAQIESDQRLLIQFAEEKVQLAVQGYDLLEQHLAQADLDIVHLEAVVSFSLFLPVCSVVVLPSWLSVAAGSSCLLTVQAIMR